MKRSLSLLLGLALLSLLGTACGDDDGSAGNDSGPGFDAAPDAGPLPDAAPADAAPDPFVESWSPTSPPAVRMNQRLAVTFAPGAQADDWIDLETVSAEIDGVPARLFPVYEEGDPNRELRLVPFPVWTPGAEITVRILAGVAYAGSGESLGTDFVWTFRIEDAPFTETFDPATTPDLTADELALAVGDATRFVPADVVTDWQDPGSTLYLVSAPVDPTDPDVLALGAKLRDSLASVSGVGLAAPQIGVNRRLFGARLPGRAAEAYVDPVIVDWSRGEIQYWYNGQAEGCLSIPGVSARVARPQWVVVSYFDASGTWVEGDTLEGNTAVVFLHEYDHLNGILITDRQEQQ